MDFLLKEQKKDMSTEDLWDGRLGGEHESLAGLRVWDLGDWLINPPLCKTVPEGYKMTFTALYITENATAKKMNTRSRMPPLFVAQAVLGEDAGDAVHEPGVLVLGVGVDVTVPVDKTRARLRAMPPVSGGCHTGARGRGCPRKRFERGNGRREANKAEAGTVGDTATVRRRQRC